MIYYQSVKTVLIQLLWFQLCSCVSGRFMKRIYKCVCVVCVCVLLFVFFPVSCCSVLPSNIPLRHCLLHIQLYALFFNFIFCQDRFLYNINYCTLLSLFVVSHLPSSPLFAPLISVRKELYSLRLCPHQTVCCWLSLDSSQWICTAFNWQKTNVSKIDLGGTRNSMVMALFLSPFLPTHKRAHTKYTHENWVWILRF